MDVSGWTLAQRMRLPDWCFGDRSLVGLVIDANGVGVTNWEIHPKALPANIAIWQASIIPLRSDSTNDYIRMGLRATVPTSEAEMDTAIPILPDFGYFVWTPPRVYLSDGAFIPWTFNMRTAFATAGLKLVLELHSALGRVSTIFSFVYSELPTSMAGWLAHNKV